jgi:hypothetical protein
LFGVSPRQRWFADEKALNKLRTPTGDAFFNRVIETDRLQAELEGASIDRSQPVTR